MSDTLQKTELTDKKQKPWLFSEGKSGNPSGRPKQSFSLKTRIIKELKKTIEYKKANGEVVTGKAVDLLARNIVGNALKSDHRYADMILKHIDGMPKQQVEVEANIQSTETKINIDIQAKLELDPEAKAALESFNNRIIGHLK